MTDDDLVALLDRAGDALPVGPPPIDRLVGGVGSRRRTRVLLPLAAAAAVVVAAALVLPGLRATPEPEARRADVPAVLPELPSGRTWVGFGRVLLPAEDAWLAPTCHGSRVAVGSRVVVRPAPTSGQACDLAYRVPEPGTVQVALDSGGAIAGPRESGSVDGVEVVRAQTACTGGFEAGCTATLVVPEDDVIVSVTVFGTSPAVEERAQEILSGVRVLRGWAGVPDLRVEIFGPTTTTTPLGAATVLSDLVNRAGLEPVLVPDPTLPDSGWGAVVTDPEAGEVVPANTRVEIRYRP